MISGRTVLDKNTDIKLERSKLAAEILLRRRELRIEEHRLKLEERKFHEGLDRPWYTSNLPWLGPTLGALVAVLTVVLNSYFTDAANIEERRTATIATERNERFKRESQILLQATNGVSHEEALRNLTFYADIGYLTENIDEIRQQIKLGIAPTTNALPDVQREIERIIVGADKSGIDRPDITPEQIRQSYIEELGWHDVGFHFIVMQSGEVVSFRDLDQIPAVALGKNAGSIGIGLQVIQKIRDGIDPYSNAQTNSLKSLLRSLAEAYQVPRSEIYRVTDFRPIKIGMSSEALSELTAGIPE